MKVTWKMIDKEMRFRGRILKLVFRPSKWFFKLMHSTSKRGEGKELEGYDASQNYIPSRDDGREIRVRVYKNERSDTHQPGVLHIHGGGFALGSPEGEHNIIKHLLDTKDCVIVSPAFRNSLDEPYPAAINDCYDTLKWMIKNAESLNIDTDKIVVLGLSGGGGLTAAVTLMARDLEEVNISFQMPLCPMIDYRNNSYSAMNNNAPVWNQKHNQIGWDLYIGHLDPSEITPYASPALNEDFNNLPPAVTYVGELDPFCSETVDYFKKLKQAGVEAKYKVFPGTYHGFEVLTNGKTSKEALQYFLENFKNGLEKYSSTQPT